MIISSSTKNDLDVPSDNVKCDTENFRMSDKLNLLLLFIMLNLIKFISSAFCEYLPIRLKLHQVFKIKQKVQIQKRKILTHSKMTEQIC